MDLNVKAEASRPESRRSMKSRLSSAAACVAMCLEVATAAQQTTTAWKDGQFHVDVGGVLSRSAVVLGQPNLLANQAMPLGNGRLGVAVWSADGLTLQLNRVDTLPRRLSTGQVVIPGLAALTRAKDYSGRLDLYNGEFVEHGGGLSAKVYVQPGNDAVVVEVDGADPAQPQTVELKLWEPRQPRASAAGKIGLLAESWKDDQEPGASGRMFGSLSGITALGRNVSVTVSDTYTITLRVTPEPDGRFRVIVASPHFDGSGDPLGSVRQAVTDVAPQEHRVWWNAFWQRAGLIRVASADGAGQYLENLRSIFLFSSAAENGGEYPGSQAGIGDMFSSVRDTHHWAPASFWHWNLRMQVAANLSAGLPELNAPYFRLYREGLPSITQWTKQHMEGHAGVCVPETMRFNGPGIEFERWGKDSTALDCALDFTPYYNARTLSTGAEVSLWIWQQYLATGDRAFLGENFPVMEAAARFLMDYEKPGDDGLRHTHPTNAHEDQWDVTDSTTDICARRALYPAAIDAAKTLGQNEALVRELDAAVSKVPPLPRTQMAKPLSLLPVSADSEGHNVIAESYAPAAERHNVENIGLEPVWPYALIVDDSPMFALALRTYQARPNPVIEDWSYDPIQAARLHLGSEVGSTLLALTEKYQKFVNGFADWGDPAGEFYVEQSGIVAAALAEALVQDYDGIIRIAPAVPSNWDIDGSVYVRGKTRVNVQVRQGVPTTVVIEAGTTGTLTVRNPWPGAQVRVLSSGAIVHSEPAPGSNNLRFSAAAGHSYQVEKSGTVTSPFSPISGEPAQSAKTLGPVHIGLPPANK